MPPPELHKFQILKFVHKFIHHRDQLPSVYFYLKNRILFSYFWFQNMAIGVYDCKWCVLEESTIFTGEKYISAIEG